VKEECLMSLAMVAIWVLMGLLVGLLAGFVTRAGGYGRKGDIVLGLVGSLGAGGLLWTAGASQELVATAVVAFLGAATVIVFQRTVWPLPVLAYWPRGR
jgi:uncharacterized membrane protein YeaQ/YmgE (transglycosylase-associated protein family)